ncbi:MAG: hypothetical protein NVSMB24_07580 [Mucilaginibacter sp.]
MLEHVSSIQLNSKSYPLLIVGGLIIIAISFYMGGTSHSNPAGQGVLIVVGVVIASLYFFTRQHTCIISSDGGSKIMFSTANMKRDGLMEFIDKIEDAKSQKVQMRV